MPDAVSPIRHDADRNLLGETARQLLRLSAEIDRVPAVDVRRVQAIRTALQNESYRLDAETVAAKLLSFETRLFPPRP